MRTWKNIGEKENADEPKIMPLEKSLADMGTPEGNKIHFYSDISKESILNLNKQIDELTKQMKIVQLTYNLAEPPPIEIHICSDGGDVLASMATVDKIRNSTIPIWTFCEGVVASSATLLSAVGHKRFITRNSCMLIHQVSSILWGNYAQFKDEIKNLDLLMVLIKSVYLKNTKFKSKELDKILQRDIFLNAEECQKFGLIDYILG